MIGEGARAGSCIRFRDLPRWGGCVDLLAARHPSKTIRAHLASPSSAPSRHSNSEKSTLVRHKRQGPGPVLHSYPNPTNLRRSATLSRCRCARGRRQSFSSRLQGSLLRDIRPLRSGEPLSKRGVLWRSESTLRLGEHRPGEYSGVSRPPDRTHARQTLVQKMSLYTLSPTLFTQGRLRGCDARARKPESLRTQKR